MNVEQLVVALERRAMDREKVVVVQTRGNKLTEIGDVTPEHGLIVLKLWKPNPPDLWR
jgi:hypothetical protein